MFKKGKLMFIYSESPVHAGAGEGIGAIDLPIQRERVTNWPAIYGTGIKGALRECFAEDDPDTAAVFGPLSTADGGSAGALSVGDAKLLLFPVRSLKGTFAYITCPLALKRLNRDIQALEALAGTPRPTAIDENLGAAIDLINVATQDVLQELPQEQCAALEITPVQVALALVDENLRAGLEIDLTDDQEILVTNSTGSNACKLLIPVGNNSNNVLLEELAFNATTDEKVQRLAAWFSDKWPTDAPWIDLEQRLAVVSDDIFKDFVEFSTEVVTRNRINNETRTVQKGALWVEESIPCEALLYSLILAADPFKPTVNIDNAGKVLAKVSGSEAPKRIMLGGDITVGHGVVRLRFS